MKAMFIHQSFPAHFKFLAPALARAKQEVVCLSHKKPDPNARWNAFRHVLYDLPQQLQHDAGHPYLKPLKSALQYGEAAARACQGLKKNGFYPDIVIVHPGWGEGLFIKDIYPETKVLLFLEYFFRPGQRLFADGPVDPETALHEDFSDRMSNAIPLLSLEGSDWGMSPTHWQKSTFPRQFQPQISVLHEGVNTERFRPRSGTTVLLPDGTVLTSSHKVVTYVTRTFEECRGFRTFMMALPEILVTHPDCYVLLLGEDGVTYGINTPEARSLRQTLCEQLQLDQSKVYFLGRRPKEFVSDVLAISTVHVYLTIPFVLSWSMLEAMSSGCLVVGSDTAPVREVITDGYNGLLTDFHGTHLLAERVCAVLANPRAFRILRERARETVLAGYDAARNVLRQVSLITRLASGEEAISHQPIGRERECYESTM
jgi:glycosyltransferase involved in cell wall biosynthesis